jgi:RHS repeat-associated protein
VYGDDLLNQIRRGQRTYYHYDALGSTRVLISPTGAISDSYQYDAFGNLAASTGNTPNLYLFTGEQFDSATGFYYLRARYTDPAAGRFITTDPFSGRESEPASLNKYIYAQADPVNKIDPLGTFTLGELNAGMNEIASATRAVAIQFGRGNARLAGRLMNELGKTAEQWVNRIVKQCLRPKKNPTPGSIAGSKKQIDLIIDIERDVLNLEAKSRIPAYGSAALRRLRDQLLAAQQAGKKVIVVGADKVSNERLRTTIEYLKRAGVKTSGPTGVEFVNGLVSFALWISEVYGEECLGL